MQRGPCSVLLTLGICPVHVDQQSLDALGCCHAENPRLVPPGKSGRHHGGSKLKTIMSSHALANAPKGTSGFLDQPF